MSLNGYDYPTFIRQSDGTYLTPPGIDATLCKVNGTTCTANKADTNGATYALTFNHDGTRPIYKAGNKFTFSETGGPLSDADSSGNAIVYHWNTKGIIESITNAEGRVFKRTFHKLTTGFEATASWTDVTSGKKVSYAYNTSNQLVTYTDASAHKTKYAYDEGGELKEVTDATKHVTTLNYDNSHRIKKITGPEVNGVHPTWTYTYYEIGKAPSPCTASQKATVLTETEGNEEPALTYCANAFDEVEQVFGYPSTGQPGWYMTQDEAPSESVAASVNLASGNLLVKSEDISPSQETQNMTLDRFYNSQATQASGTLGARWRWGTGPSVYLLDEEARVVLHGPNGYVVILTRVSNETYTGPEEFEGTLTKNPDGTYTLTNENNPTYQFNSAGALTSETTEQGNIFTVGDTTLSGKTVLHSLTPSSGKAFEVTYDSTPHVTQTTDPGSHARHYEYDSVHRLKTYTDASGGKTEYEYSPSGDLTKITMPDGTVERITYSNGRVAELTGTPPGGEAGGAKFSYEAPTSPACNPATDAGETVVTAVPSGESETACYDRLGHRTGPKTEAEEETEGSGTPEEVPAETCYEAPPEPPADCGEEELPPESPEGPAASAQRGSAPNPTVGYGLSDNNDLFPHKLTKKEEEEGRKPPTPFNYFAEAPIKALGVTRYRRVIPWNTALEAQNDDESPGLNHGAKILREDVEEWVNQVVAVGGQPLISFDHCPYSSNPLEETWEDPTVSEDAKDDKLCSEAPSKVAYQRGVEAFFARPVLSKVANFTPWNEPNLLAKVPGRGIFVEPTAEKPQLAGEYWGILAGLCKPKAPGHNCRVAAGDFADNSMGNAYNPNNRKGEEFKSYKWFKLYKKGMRHPQTATAWAWHAYLDGEETKTTYHNGSPQKWWKRFRNFVEAVRVVSKNGPHHHADIWLTEQGVRFSLNLTPLPAWQQGEGVADGIMNAYVNHGGGQLTRQSSHITRFYYYETRGGWGRGAQDSGLLEVPPNPEFPTQPKARRAVSAPRAIYKIYARKTTGK